LGGVAVGGFVTWKIQDRQLKHADESRFQEQRMETYLDFITSANSAFVLLSENRKNEASDCLGDVYRALQKMRLISTKQTTSKIDAIVAVLNSTDNTGDPDQKLEHFKAVVKDFWDVARKELKIEL